MVSLLQTKSILKNELLLIRLLDRTFQRACDLRTLDYKTELPHNIKKEFGKNIFSLQFDKYITEIIKESLIYADKTMKKMAAAKVNESYILTEEAVRISKDLSQEASESIVRILQDDAIYYEHPKTLSKRIVDLWGGEKYRAERFARTFTADVATATTVARYRQYGVRYMEFDAELDDRTTNQCRCLNGVIFDLEKESVDRYRPPLHMHCLCAKTFIKTYHMDKYIEDIQIGDMVLTHTGQYMPVTATMSRIPEEIIEISTDKRTIRITPNHPILCFASAQGVSWRMAGDFHVGDVLVSLDGYEAIQRILSVPIEPVYNISVSVDESYVANGIIVHNCRSGLVPLTEDEYKPDMEFENRNFNNVLDNPDDVSSAFKNIDTFNEKYRVSKFTLDQDLGARIMFDKGFSVGISGPDLSGLVQGVPGKVEFVPAKTVKEADARISAFTTPNTAPVNPAWKRYEQGMNLKGVPLDAQNSMLKAFEDTLERNNTKVNFIGLQERGLKTYGRCSTGYDGSSAIYMQKTFLTNPAAAVEHDKRVFLAGKERNLTRISNGLKDSRPQQLKDLLLIEKEQIESTVRWAVLDDADDPIFACVKHESYHAVYRNNNLEEIFKSNLVKHEVMKSDWYTVSEYAGKNVEELFCEAGTANDLSMSMSPKIKAAFLDTVSEL